MDGLSRSNLTDEQFLALVEFTRAVRDTIKELGRVPSGHLYAILMGKVTINVYLGVIEALKKANLVKEVAHELIWVGGK